LSEQQVEHLFRHKYGKLVALLLRKFGIQHIETVEDAVQWSMAQALDFWSKENIPSNLSAWLYQVAHRYLLSELRAKKSKKLLLTQYSMIEDVSVSNDKEASFSSEMNNSMLRMLFIACHEKIPVESQLVFTLKSLCGFSIREISLRLFISQANVYKRFSRAKNFLKDKNTDLNTLTDAEIIDRIPAIHHVLYLLYTEGYLSSHDDKAIRQDLCDEAIRLLTLLIDSKFGNLPNSKALLALMYFHSARINSRKDECGLLLLLEQQDRSKWNEQQITLGLALLEQSAVGDNISRYHIEAGIAAEHCLSSSFQQTRWDNIIASYELLDRIAPSPIHIINRAIATAEWKGPHEGLAVLNVENIPSWLSSSYYWYAAKADLYFRCGDAINGNAYATLAISAAPTDHIKSVLTQRLTKR